MNAQRIRLLLRHGWATWSTHVAVALWSTLLVGGWWSLERYESTASGPLAQGYADGWPADSGIERQSDRPMLLFFIHPKCPCTRASLYELERVLRSLEPTSGRSADVVVVATVPRDADESWLETDTVARSHQLPNSRFIIDRDGVEAARFGATASGTVLVFDAAGHRQYAGGVTIARGHEGGNAGIDAVERILRGQVPTAAELPTFGCRLCLPESSRSQSLHANTASRSPSRMVTESAKASPSAP